MYIYTSKKWWACYAHLIETNCGKMPWFQPIAKILVHWNVNNRFTKRPEDKTINVKHVDNHRRAKYGKQCYGTANRTRGAILCYQGRQGQ